MDEIMLQEDPQVKNIRKTDDIILGYDGTNAEEVFVVPGDRAINQHVCVVGGAGCGKTWSYTLGNILQKASAQESMFILDAGEELYGQAGAYLRSRGYTVKQINASGSTEDDVDPTLPGKTPCAYFCYVSPFDAEVNANAAALLTAALDRLIQFADTQPDQKCPVPVHFFLDEFCNIGRIENFHMKLVAARKRGISISILLQSVVQLKALYGEDWMSIFHNCDTQVCLGTGSYDIETLEAFERRIDSVMHAAGMQQQKPPHWTQRHRNPSPVYQQKYPELTTLNQDECLVVCRNDCAKKLLKFPLHKHPDYELLSKVPDLLLDDPSNLAAQPARTDMWGEDGTCPYCGKNVYDSIDANISSRYAPPFCPNCGTNMSPGT